jgi:outer membrane lipoprotein-sorting protein
MSDFYKDTNDAKAKAEIQEQITSLGIEFRLLTQFTSFVAVEDQIVNQNGKPTRVEVPVKSPDGMNRESDTPFRRMEIIASLQRPPSVSYSATGAGRGSGSGNGNGSGSGNGTGDISTLREEKKAFNALRVDGSDSPENTLVVESRELPVLTSGQDDSDSKMPNAGALTEILKRMEAHQKALRTLHADLTMTKFNAQLSETEIKQGAVKFIPQTNDYWLRIDSTNPVPESFSIIGNQYLVYLPNQKTARMGTITDTQKNEFVIFSQLAKGKLKEIYEVKYLGAEKVNGIIPAWHLELTPKTKSGSKTIELWVDASGMIIQSKSTETNGDWSNISLTNLQKNVRIQATDCRIALPGDTKIVKN